MASSQINVELSAFFINQNEVLGTLLFYIKNWPIQEDWSLMGLCHFLQFQIQSDRNLETSAKWGIVGKVQTRQSVKSECLGKATANWLGEVQTSPGTFPLRRQSSDLIPLFLGSGFMKHDLAVLTLAVHQSSRNPRPAH